MARAAALGLTLTEVAQRMGTSKQELNHLFSLPRMPERTFLRLSAALGMQADDWDRPLPRPGTPLEKVRRMRRNVHQIRTGKNRAQLVEPVPDATLNSTGADGAEKG